MMHGLCTLLLPPNLELCEDCLRRMTWTRSGLNSSCSGCDWGAAAEADVIGLRCGAAAVRSPRNRGTAVPGARLRMKATCTFIFYQGHLSTGCVCNQ